MINDGALILICSYTTHALIDKMQNCIETLIVMNINGGFIKIDFVGNFFNVFEDKQIFLDNR